MKHASREKSFERRVFESLYGDNDFDKGINDALALIGKEFHISRVYIFENSEDNRFGNNTYEWCANGIEPKMDTLQHMSYEEYGYDKLFTKTGEFICPDTSKLADLQRELFESQSIKATLQYAIFNKGEFCGFVGFDDCITTRHDWEEDVDELDALMFLSQLLSVYLIKDHNLRRAELYQKKMREALEYEKLFNKLSTGVGIFEYKNGTIQSRYLNDGYYRMLHTTRAEREKYLDEKTTLAIYEEDRKGLYQLTVESIKQGTTLSHNVRVIDGNGVYVWLNIIGNAFLEDGIPVFYVSFTEITESLRQRELMQAKYEQQLQYVKLLSSDAMASSMVNLTKNIITQQSTADGSIMEVITQQTPQQGFELMYTHIPDPKIREQYASIFDRDIIISNLKKGISTGSIVHPQDHFSYWLESGYIAVENPENGDVEAYCYAKDVSDIVLQNSISSLIMSCEYENVALLNPESGELKKVIIDRRHDSTLQIDPVTKVDSEWKRRIGFAYTQERLKTVLDRLSIETIKEALLTEPSYSVMFSECEEGSTKINRKKTTYMYVDCYQSAILSLTQDVTVDYENEMKQHAALQAALDLVSEATKSKADFYSRMSHDMRTPMNGILGITELASKETDLTRLHEDIDKIHQAGVYMLSLINDTLDLQRIESGRMTLEPRICNMKELIEGILSMIQTSAKEKDISIEVRSINTQLSNYIRIDPVRVRQVVLNLMSNSIKFTPEGGKITFSVEVLSLDQTHMHNKIIVSDTGVGMSESFLENGLFIPFMQEQNEMTMKHAGTGLGLSIVKKLLDMMGARIEVQSEIGVGTTFTIYIDFEIVPDEEVKLFTQNNNAQLNHSDELINGKRILLCEDHPLNAEKTMRLNEKAGGNIEWARNGAEGVDLFSKSAGQYYDAILMDIRMPGMDGLEATRMIRATNHPDAKTISIIAMSANAYKEDIEKSLAAGMNAHLAKPVSPDKLYTVLAAHINKGK